MPSLAELVALVLLVALVAYTVTGGADFGGGVWDLLASGPRKDAQRQLVARAIAPIWEANHVWLILVIVILFVALPTAFSAIMTALHIPLVLALVGIVLRGAAFVFRSYDPDHGAGAARWRVVFAIASTVTPVALGTCLGALVSGRLALTPDARVAVDFISAWAHPFALGVGVFVLVILAWLAATYSAVAAGDDDALADDFRKRGLISGILAALIAHILMAVGIGPAGAAGTVVQALVGALGVGALYALWARAYRPARLLAAAQVAGIVIGLGLALYPHIIPPGLTFAAALAPDHVVTSMLIAIAIGMPFLLAALFFLYRVFAKPDDTEAP